MQLRSLVAAVVIVGTVSCGASHPSGGAVSSGASPVEILAAARAAFASAKSFRFLSTGYDVGNSLEVAVAGPDAVTLTYGNSDYGHTALELGGQEYVLGNVGYYKLDNARYAALAAGRWVHTHGSVDTIVAKIMADLGRDARCLLGTHGSLKAMGETSIDGHRAAEIVDAGDVPDAIPSQRYIALDGPPYLLRLVQTGPSLESGTVDCLRLFGLSTRAALPLATVNFGSFGSVPMPEVPRDSINETCTSSSPNCPLS